ncbi:hypothetical protein [Burkholderia orbicola]|uniref:hypothetical protein n=1 Tax=Burkholderia orbicola TaxID=2978683 RepID=UPI00264AB26E|nr:hypothetical protein [Burkholderia orbicola]MDN7560762.1 hypothetical protein [Burkholderia orbicola]
MELNSTAMAEVSRLGSMVRLAGVLLLALGPGIGRAVGVVTDHEIGAILAARCAACHSAHPTLMSSAPKGLFFTSPAAIDQHAHAIYRQVCELRAMPVGNVTNMTDAERKTVALWFNERSNSDQVKAAGAQPH